MMIHQQAGSRQHEQLSVRRLQRAVHAALVFVVVALLAAVAGAQASSQLNGSATDASGAVVANAKITLTNTATGAQRTTASNASGLYQFLEVPPGDYKLDAVASGFAPFAVDKLTLLVKLPSTVNIHFEVAGGKTSVTVEGEAPLINRTDASLGNVVEQSQIAELPVPGRSRWIFRAILFASALRSSAGTELFVWTYAFGDVSGHAQQSEFRHQLGT